jgi:hypothetical protein
VHTDSNVADPLTKALPQPKHEAHMRSMDIRTYISDASVRGRVLCREYVYVIMNNCYLFHG